MREIIPLGMSGFIMQATNCLVQVVCNATLKIYGGDLYVGIMTVINSVREILSLLQLEYLILPACNLICHRLAGLGGFLRNLV